MSKNNSSSKKPDGQSSILSFFGLNGNPGSSHPSSKKRTFNDLYNPEQEYEDKKLLKNPAFSAKKKIIDDDDVIEVPNKTNKPIVTPSFNQLPKKKYKEEPEDSNKKNFNVNAYLKKNLDLQLAKDPHCFDKNIIRNYTTQNIVIEEEDKPKNLKIEKESTTVKKKKNNKKGTASDVSDVEGMSDISADEGLVHNDLFQNPENGLPYFLQSNNIRDKFGKKPDDPDYDPTTLFVPDDYIKEQTPVMKQFWIFKRDNFDKVLFFKLGKFYELFFDDAIIGNSVLELNWMGNDPKKLHVGFPEKIIEEKANRLIKEGYKVAVIEQTETPEQLKERMKSSAKKEKCVNRELCNVFTKGTYLKIRGTDKGINTNNKFCITLIFNQKLVRVENPNSQSLQPNSYGIIPSPEEENEEFKTEIEWGITIFDVTTLNFYIGIINEDINSNDSYTKLKTMLYNINPEELIIVTNNIPDSVLSFIKTLSCRPQVTTLKSNYELKNLNKLLETYLGDDFEKWNEVIMNAITNEDKLRVVCMSLYYTIVYLEKILLAKECIPTGNFHSYNNDTDQNKINPNKKLLLDYQAISNLELLETKLDPKNPASGSLVEYLNKAVTPFGKRMMKNWILNPLCVKKQIEERLDMVEDFINNEDLLTMFRESLGKWMDIERHCSRFFKLAMRRNSKAIYFEDVTKYQLKDFFKLVNFISTSRDLFNIFTPFIKQGKIKQGLVKKIQSIPEIEKHLSDVTENFHIVDTKDEKGGSITRIEAKPGVSKEYDECKEKITEIVARFDEIIKKERKRLKCAVICYAHTKFYKYELEIPEEYVKVRPKEYILTTSKKGYLRFHTPEILKNISELEEATETLKTLTKDLNKELFKFFYSKHAVLSQYISSVGELDCLACLAHISSANTNQFCRPKFIELSDNQGYPYIEIRDSIHPCLINRIQYFVPNDIIIGKDQKPLIVITGPNMGGKSTLLRQVCVAVIMGQLGCYVPAKSATMTVVDRIFTRIGASDRLLEGKSTFYIEMEETKNILSNATINSLVIMDELGRGTSTHDGKIIAKTVLDRLEKRIKCRTLFTTHYHDIISWCGTQRGIDLWFMDSNVNTKTKDIQFLYKFKRGICPESYGVSVAKLAGLPMSIINMAEEVARKNRTKIL